MHQYKGRELLFIIEIAISFSINDQKITNKENTCIAPFASSHTDQARLNTRLGYKHRG